MTPETLMMPEEIFMDGRNLVSAEELPIPEWLCVITERPQPTLTIKEDIARRCQETGYLSYLCQSRRSLVNQGWKDSGNCIVDHTGQLATDSIALCEVLSSGEETGQPGRSY